MLQVGILKKPIPPTEKNPAEASGFLIRMPSLALAGSVTELGGNGNGSLARRLNLPKKFYLR
jgi:hypothetical protein